MENAGMLRMRTLVTEPFQSAGMHLSAEQVTGRLESVAAEPRPIWMSVLEASSCQARSRERKHIVRWEHVSGRATYTNLGSEEEHIEPLGICVPRGKTVAVSWRPGETEYTVEIYKQ